MEYVLSIKKLAKYNENFREVLVTGKQSQLVLMSLKPGEDIGEEVHPTTDQMFFIEDGAADLEIDGRAIPLNEHEVGFVPAGTRHNLVNVGRKPLKLYTVYSPPVHAPNEVQTSARKHAAT